MARPRPLAVPVPRVPRRVAATLCAALAAASVATPAVSAASFGGSWHSATLDPGLSVAGSHLEKVVVSGATGAAQAVRDAVRAAGGVVGRDLAIVNGVSATVPADRLVQLDSAPGVTAVTEDRSAKMDSASYDTTTSNSNYTWTSQAANIWTPANQGAGVTVAVLDTGISRVNDLAGRVGNGPDMSGDNLPAVDEYGHGTVMAGIIAGSGADSQPSPRTGVAPQAKVVSVKVAGANGVTDVSTVLAGMTWVAAFQNAYGIKVMNLSWGVPSTQNPNIDPLNFAVERLWQLGVVVVVAAGNSGPNSGTITKPGDDPLVITAGAYDDHQDSNPANDSIPAWSSEGPTAQGLAKPDLVSPGRTLIATYSPNSTVVQQNPNSLVPPSYIRGSGTSEATALTSGGAALLLAAHPTWTPDQVKYAMTSTASPIPGVLSIAQGAGRIQLASASAANVLLAPVQVGYATGLGTLEGSRGSSGRVTITCNGTSLVLNTENTTWCTNWNGGAWTGGAWTGGAWTGGAWTGGAWTGDMWASNAWTGGAWTGGAWTGGAWTGGAWTGMGWTGGAWTGGAWTSAGYDDGTTMMTAFWGKHPRWNQQVAGEVSDLPPAAGHVTTACSAEDSCA